MEAQYHSVNALFEQLGLPASDQEIEAFVERYRPLRQEVPIHKASFWQPAQAAALAEMLSADSDWAVAVDRLNSMLR